MLLGGAVGNGSTRRIEDRMNFWMTFATFSPGQVTAMHPCIAQFIVCASAIARPLKPGELESSVILTFEMVPGAVFVDPELVVWHHQSHAFWNHVFAAHFHNGRATERNCPAADGGRGLGVRCVAVDVAGRGGARPPLARGVRRRHDLPLVRAGRLLRSGR